VKGTNKKVIGLILTVMFLWISCITALAEEEREKGYYIVYEEGTNKKIFSTARVLYVGDQYLNEQNILYEIVRISGDKAYAEFKERVDIQRSLDFPESQAMAEVFEDEQDTLKFSDAKKEKVIAIYHTHSDESYIPTDGKSSIPHRGGIYKVGTALKTALEKKGIKTIQSFQSHDPHDSMAYQRSRRTATELLKNTPDAIVDIHRDAVPAEEYQGSVNGQPLAKIQLVVGRQNPQMNTINNFAKQLKATSDKKYPGLIKGIFYGQGGYNQDMYPRSILIEAGTYTNSRYKAEDGANIMADVVATTLYGEDYEKKITPGGGATTKIPGEGGGASKALLWIVGIIIVGFGAYMLISTGGINELSAKIKRFSGREFANFLGNNTSNSKERNEECNFKGQKKDNEE
jgi:stage II sporulation protein P